MEGTLTNGKKWASGTGSTAGSIYFEHLNNVTAKSFSYITIQLDFKPSVIVVSGSGSDTEYFSVFNNLGKLWGNKNVKLCGYSGNYLNTTTHNMKVDSGVDLGNNTYQIPLYKSSTSVSWVAYE